MRSWLVVLAAMGCGGGSPTAPEGKGEVPAPDPGASGETRDMLVIGWQADVGNLNPVVYETAWDGNVIEALNFPLIDSEFDCSLKKKPALAKSWAWSEDGKVIQMELRDDIRWEDGKPVTAEDIAFSYELVSDPAVSSPRFGYIERLAPDGRPKIIDATHLEWHFTVPYDRDSQMSHVSMDPLPKHIWQSADRATLRGNEHTMQPLASGPWRLAKWEPQQRLVLEPNPAFTGPPEWKAHLNRVVFRVIPDYQTRIMELEKGTIDLMEQVLVSDADRLREEHPEIKLMRRGWRSNDFLAWNLKDPLFADVRVRRALAMATDIDAMIARLLTSKTGEKYARPAIGTVTPALCGAYNEDVTPIGFDLDGARALLAEAGWTPDKDGILRNAEGQPFEFRLSAITGNKRRADASVLIQDQLRKVGVVANLEKLEANTFYQALRQHQFQAAIGGWSAALFVDPSSVWHCPSEGKKYEFNFTGYCNPEVDALIDRGLSTPDPKDAAPIWKELQEKIYADQPYRFLWWMDEIVAVHERFENTQIDTLSPFGHLNEWEVPADKVKYKH
jgi:peptide/nickel transport system substrate-binding protein